MCIDYRGFELSKVVFMCRRSGKSRSSHGLRNGLKCHYFENKTLYKSDLDHVWKDTNRPVCTDEPLAG